MPFRCRSSDAAVRNAFSAYSKRRDLSDGIISSLKVSNPRGDGHQLRDRLSRRGKPRRRHDAKDPDVQSLDLTNIGLLISRGRGHLAVYEHGQRGALAIGTSLRSLPLSAVTLGAHYLGQRIVDSVLGGTDELDEDSDMAHGWATWLAVVLADDSPAQVDADAVTGWADMFQASAIDIRETSSLLMRIVRLVEEDGFNVDRGGDGDIVDRIWTQLALDDLLDQVFSDSMIIAAARQRKEEQRAARREHITAIAQRDTSFDQMTLSTDLLGGGLYRGKDPRLYWSQQEVSHVPRSRRRCCRHRRSRRHLRADRGRWHRRDPRVAAEAPADAVRPRSKRHVAGDDR